MRKSLIQAAKWAWLVCVLVAAGLVIARSWDEIVEMLRGLAPLLLVGSIVLTAVAKLLLAENARIAADRCGVSLHYLQAARLYNLSQLGKYLPGSIWQFVGRAAAYRNLGATFPQIRDSLLTESLWILAAAALVGALLTGPGIVDVVTQALSPALAWWLVGLAGLGLLAVAAIAVYRWSTLLAYLELLVPPVRAVFVQAVIWVLLGAAFWCLLSASGIHAGVWFPIGLFAAAYAVGFMVPFAPAGLGVRDGILVLGLLPFTTTAEAVAIALLARVVYLVVDVALALGPELVLLVARPRSL